MGSGRECSAAKCSASSVSSNVHRLISQAAHKAACFFVRFPMGGPFPCKPDSVPVTSRSPWTVISLPACAGPHLREVRLLPGDIERVALPCSVLHHVGFALPPRLPSVRWALTPPFQPYLIPASGTIGGVFSAALSIKVLSRSPRPHFSRGTLPCGVRTFLNTTCAALRPSRKRRHRLFPIASNSEDNLNKAIKHALRQIE
ncbi:MAG: hypothetical protein RI957_1902 [Verrucomicrobiota bacterium]